MTTSPYTVLDFYGHTEHGHDVYDCRVWCYLCEMPHSPCEVDEYGAEHICPPLDEEDDECP